MRIIVLAVAAAVSLVLAGSASAHAIMSPPVAKAKVSQQFTLSVPTEEEGATTTEIELTVPDGLAIDSFEPTPGWKREEQATRSGWSRCRSRTPSAASQTTSVETSAASPSETSATTTSPGPPAEPSKRFASGLGASA